MERSVDKKRTQTEVGIKKEKRDTDGKDKLIETGGQRKMDRAKERWMETNTHV